LTLAEQDTNYKDSQQVHISATLHQSLIRSKSTHYFFSNPDNRRETMHKPTRLQ